jgi:hypothetical protein
VHHQQREDRTGRRVRVDQPGRDACTRRGHEANATARTPALG